MSQNDRTVRIPARPDRTQESRGSLGFAEVRSLKRQLLEELRSQSEAGSSLRAEDLLPRWPTDPQADPDVASLLFEDYLRRRRQGEHPSASDYEERFPEHRDSLAGLFRHQAVRQSLGDVSAEQVSLRLPDVGEELFGFQLRVELGRGAFARVFLAGQGSLADRPVVLKVSAIEGDEPRTLAQLQHTHIVPIYSVHEDAAAGLRAVCMPYFGGASLSRVLQALWSGGTPPTQGEQFVRALQTVQAPPWNPGTKPGAAEEKQEEAAPGPLSSAPCSLSYVQLTASLVAQLAEALQHAHQRGVLHRDVKPSNILIGADGQPMLLDFNLAHDLHNDQARAMLGGTVAYMAPEHLRALAERDLASSRRVDHRADLYALGMVLFEMLAGHGPFEQSASYTPLPLLIEAMALERSRSVPSLRRRRPDVPWSLESIVRKCLAPDPAQRYQQAEHLADDLKRFLEDRPLRYAPELSRVERCRKWLRRHPRLTSSATVASVAGVLLACTGIAAGLTVAGVSRHLETARQQLVHTEAAQCRRSYEEGTVRALCLVNTTSATPDHTRQGLAACEQTLALFHVLDRDDWQDDPHWQALEADDRRRLAEDTRELLLLLARARVQQSQTDSRQSHDGGNAELRNALVLLDRAEAIADLPPSSALLHDRASYLERLGETEAAAQVRARAEQTPPASARDHYLLATTYLRSADGNTHEAYTRALAELDEAIRLEPHHYWSWIQRGICHQEQGRHDLAVSDFGVCIGLWPEFALGYFNRGYSLARLGHPTEAVADYTAALQREPNFALAFASRGSLWEVLKRPEEALADFERAAQLGQDDAALRVRVGEALEALGRTQEADAAFRTALERLEGADDAVTRDVWLKYGFAVYQRLPKRAWEAFSRVLRQEPGHPQALSGQALVLAAQDQTHEALRCFDAALRSDPGFVEAHRFRAVLLARVGNFEQAGQDINWCLEKEPESGETLYAAACVSALLADKFTASSGGKPTPESEAAVKQALEFLRAALEHGYGRDRAAHDSDLAAVQNHPEFKKLIAVDQGTRF